MRKAFFGTPFFFSAFAGRLIAALIAAGRAIGAGGVRAGAVGCAPGRPTTGVTGAPAMVRPAR